MTCAKHVSLWQHVALFVYLYIWEHVVHSHHGNLPFTANMSRGGNMLFIVIMATFHSLQTCLVVATCFSSRKHSTFQSRMRTLTHTRTPTQTDTGMNTSPVYRHRKACTQTYIHSFIISQVYYVCEYVLYSVLDSDEYLIDSTCNTVLRNDKV